MTKPGELHVVRATARRLARINALIARSKSHWTWPEGYLEKALPLQLISRAYLHDNRCFEMLDGGGAPVAFFSLQESHGRLVLDNLWVNPEMIGKGVGRTACEYVFELAKRRGWVELWVIPDPPAEGFYLRIGFADSGERIASRVPGGPIFSVFHIKLAGRQCTA
ncbi:MAG: GNAT family N-acetyltransferase [Caulobacteraceae bacterium]